MKTPDASLRCVRQVLRYALLLAMLTGYTRVFAAYPKYMKVTTPSGSVVAVTAYDDNILKVSNYAPGETIRRGTASVLDESFEGECLNPDGNGIRANICGMEVTLESNGRLTINAGSNKTVTDSGVRTLRDGKREIDLSVSGNGAFYGAGERGHKMNLRGDTLVMYNRQNYGYTGTDPRISQMNITMPLFVSSDGYAIVFDDFAPAELILGNPVRYITESPEAVNWYFVNGARTLADVSESLSRLTGRQGLPPLWILGYITSKYGYKTQNEAEDVVDSLKAAGYPLDGLVLDLYWYGKEQDMGRLAWDMTNFHDPDDFLDYMKKRGVDVITITQPYVLRNGRGITNYRELSAAGMLMKDSTGNAPQDVKIWVGEGGMLDVANPDTRRWLADKYRTLTRRGVTGWWGDLGEPEVHPETGLHANGLTGRQYHNRYGNDWSQIVSDVFDNAFPERRLVSMMRGGTTGLQRYNVYPWSTDVSRSWGGMEPQIRIMLHAGLSGLGYMGHDVGGFAVNKAHPVDPELYVRWMQLGLFSPMLRTHATVDAEPYHYTDHQDVLLQLVKDRYRWLPYNYTLAWENATKGYPMVRPLNFHSPLENGEKYDNVTDEYLWGKDVLVAPVMAQGAVSRDIVLPAGDQWIDFNNPTKYYDGGTVIKDYPAPLEVLPLFVREGAIIPMAEYKINNTKSYNRGKLTLRYFPSRNYKTEYTMFEDDMTTPSKLSKNLGRTLTFTGDATGKGVEVTLKADGYFAAQDEMKQITLVVNNQQAEPRSVTVDGRNARFTYDKTAKTVTVAFVWKTAKEAIVKLNR